MTNAEIMRSAVRRRRGVCSLTKSVERIQNDYQCGLTALTRAYQRFVASLIIANKSTYILVVSVRGQQITELDNNIKTFELFIKTIKIVVNNDRSLFLIKI